MNLSLQKKLIDFIYDSPSPFHSVDNIKNTLIENGFAEIKEENKWELNKNGKYFVKRNDSALIAFTVGSGFVAKKRV
ncbi:aspartyl aminopeptidase [Clostridium acetobutylicum]|nr:aspartyl aminopeptidase [Clostridium acetobutylicum]